MNTIHLQFTSKEINILIQAIRIASEDGSLWEVAKQSEIDRLREKLQNVKD